MKVKKFAKIIRDKITEIETLSDVAEQSRSVVELDQQSVGRLSRQDALQQQAMALAQERNRKQELVLLKRALHRAESGDYGLCEECGEEIPEKRLEIDPATEICVNCRD